MRTDLKSELFWKRGCLSAAEAQTLVAQQQATQLQRIGILPPGSTSSVLDESTRKTFRLEVSETVKARVTYTLMSLLPELAECFALDLTACQPPQFLAYQPGDFFATHIDVIKGATRLARTRQLSVVLFLNAPPDYQGGELVIYPQPGQMGEVCRPQAGDLLAFRPEWPHEVRPVLAGLRYSVVSWFY